MNGEEEINVDQDDPEVPESEFSTSASLEDLLSEEEEDLTPQPTRIKTGVGGNQRAPRPKPIGVNPNADRFLFNPFETIDVRNEGAGCGFDYVQNVVFHQVKSLDTNVAKTDAYDLPGSGHNEDNYENFRRTAHMIATEIVNKHGDKGVILVSTLTGQDEETAGDLNTMIFGEDVLCITDPNDDEHPCPVLPTLLEDLITSEQKIRASDLDAQTKLSIRQTIRQVGDAIRLAMRNARSRIDEAQKRMLDEKNPNRALSHAEQRCYLALGQQIPNQMPFLTPSAAIGMNQGGGIDSEALGRGIAAGLQANAAAAGVGVPAAHVGTIRPATGGRSAASPVSEASAEPDFQVDEVDLENAETVAVKTGKAKKNQ